jgi:hypothetical protein
LAEQKSKQMLFIAELNGSILTRNIHHIHQDFQSYHLSHQQPQYLLLLVMVLVNLKKD